ncbi:MAG: hypothetical protein JW955_04800 [Sedimentisphaerales bacterium]|nr:hypothetical protein [Sedimentisphaerales bacterium]
MGKKTTPTKQKKAKTAARSSKRVPKVEAAPSRKRVAKGKPVGGGLKPKVAGKGPVALDKATGVATTNKAKAAKKADKIGKPDNQTTPTSKTAGKTPPRAKSAQRLGAGSAKTNAKLVTPVREPREIAGLPKLPAFGGIFERPPHREAKKTKAKESGGNGDSVDDSPSGSLAKTYLTDTELDEFRELLLAKRQEIVRDVTNLEDEAIRQASGASSSSSMPIHMADLGTDTWEQELTLGLIENERSLLREIDEAIERIENHTYGMCLATNKRISKARLQAKPWAKYCIEYARRRELGLA